MSSGMVGLEIWAEGYGALTTEISKLPLYPLRMTSFKVRTSRY